MRTHKKLAVLISVVAALALIGTAIAGYIKYTPIDDVSITSHNDDDIVFCGCSYTVTCTTSTDEDCDDEGEIVNDPVTHTWSGPGSFDPTTGTSVTWTTPGTPGWVEICVTADDSPLANDSAKSDCVMVYVSDVIYVDEDATAGNDDGTTWANAFLKLQDALDIATSGNEIWVAEGTYYPDEGDSVTNDDISESFHLVAGGEIYGGFDGTETARSQRDWENNETILSGDIDKDGLLDIDNSTIVVEGADNATIDGFTITSGGRGVYCWYCNPQISCCIISDNGNDGVYTFYSEATIEDCVIENNGSDGIYDFGYPDPPPTIIKRNQIRGNAGNGVNLIQERADVKDNWIYDNGNAGIRASGSPWANLLNNTIVGNTNYGIHNTSTAPWTISNCILWDNGDDLYDCSATYSCISDCNDAGGTGNICGAANDPDFVDPDNDDYRLAPGSPCIDAADGDVASTTDIFGNSRYDDPSTDNTGTGDPNYVDMGAYEALGPIYVDANATGDNDGSSWTNAFNYLQDALDALCSSCLEIWVVEGTYYPDEGDSVTDDDISESFHLINGVEIYGGFDGTETSRSQRDRENNETILSGDIDKDGLLDIDNSTRVVEGADNATIDGFTVTSGGRGVYCWYCNPQISCCIISDNKLNGIRTFDSEATIEDCVIENNGDDGIDAYGFTTSIIKRNQIGGNAGDGVVLSTSKADVKDNWIYDNGNAGIRVLGSPWVDLLNNTIVGNTNYGIYNYSTQPTISNCILWDNSDDLYDCSATYSCIEDGDGGTGNISSDPNFVDADAFHLSADSPCIDAGDPSFQPDPGETDIDGEPRVHGDDVDMGADEYQGQ